MIRLVEAFRDAWHTLKGRPSRDHAAEMPVVQWLKEQERESEQKAIQSDQRLHRVNVLEQTFLTDRARERGKR